MSSIATKTTFIRPDFLSCCLICGKSKNKKDKSFRSLGIDSKHEVENAAARWVKEYIGLVVSQALCCRNCFQRLESLDIKVKRMRESCRRTLKSLTVSSTPVNSCLGDETPLTKDEHNYSAGSTGLLDFGVIKIVLNTGTTQQTDSQMVENSKCRSTRGKRRGKSTAVEIKRRAIAPKGAPITQKLTENNGNQIHQDLTNSSEKGNLLDSNQPGVGGGKFQAILPKASPITPPTNSSLLCLSKRRTRSSLRPTDPPEKTVNKNQRKEINQSVSLKPILPKPTHQTDEVPVKKSKQPTVYKCQHCQEEFTSKLKYSDHLEKHDELFCELVKEEEKDSVNTSASENTDNPKQCQICAKIFTTVEKLHQHMKRTHKHPKQIFKCKLCDHKLTTKRAMHVHLLGHSVSKKFPCDYCDMTFQFRSVYLTHLKLHTKEGAQLCPQCGKIFSSSEGLRLHTNNVHLKNVEKKHVCDVCGKRFERQSKLDFHKASHSDSRDHLCDVCGKTFKHKSILNSHRKIHSKDFKPKPPKTKIHGCTVCPKRFGSLSSLADHVTICHEKECILCGATITSWQMLRQHKPLCSQIPVNSGETVHILDNTGNTVLTTLNNVTTMADISTVDMSVVMGSDTLVNSNSMGSLGELQQSGVTNLATLTGPVTSLITQDTNVIVEENASSDPHSYVTEDAVETLLLALAHGGTSSALSSHHIHPSTDNFS